MTEIRLQSALAKAGIASRRKAASLIESGRVRVNGKVVRERGFRVDTPKDRIVFDGKPLSSGKTRHYYILNKPAGVLSTVKDEFGRKKVSDYVREACAARLYPVGRLDKNTTGLIILTDDGDLTYRLTHPKFGIDRVYEVKIKGAIREKDLRRLKRGIIIEGKLARAKRVVFKKKSPDFAILLVTLREGRKREVRNMFGALELNISELKRISYGPLRLKGLKKGEARPLGAHEIVMLKKSVGLD